MTTIRKLAIAGSLAIAAAFSAGTASAAPAQALGLSLPVAEAPAVEQAYYGYHGHRRLCHVPFRRLVRWVGYHRAVRIKRRCFYGYGYGYGY